jgi:hypothetical protein
MQQRYGDFNKKRRLEAPDNLDHGKLKKLANKVQYGGNPEHKKNPGDFKLTPPCQPRSAKSLCDAVKIFTRRESLRLLRKGLRKGLISDRYKGDWPKNVWAVTEDGYPMESQLEDHIIGRYHGYPIPKSDPLGFEILKVWKERP